MTESPNPDRAVRRAILERHRSSLENWLSEEGSDVLDGDEFDTELNRNRLQALRALDPEASLEEELRLRLVAPDLADGALALDAGVTLMKPLQDSVDSLSDDHVELELVGVSPGSTILHLRARHSAGDEVEEVAGAPIDSTRSEQALRAFVELVATAESEGDLRRWPDAADALGRFSKALDKIGAQVDVSWSGVSGEVRSAWFGERGRDYVRAMLATNPSPDVMTISGRVTELRESGIVKVKTGRSRQSPAYEVRVEPEDLLGMHLELGAQVSFTVRLEAQINGLGQTQSTEVFYLGPGGMFFADSERPMDDDEA